MGMGGAGMVWCVRAGVGGWLAAEEFPRELWSMLLFSVGQMWSSTDPE